MISAVRTTLDIDEDVLQAAKELARAHGRTAGQIVSDLARRALTPPATRRVRNGVPVLPGGPEGRPMRTMRLVNRLRDEG